MVSMSKMLERAATSAIQRTMNGAAKKLLDGAINLVSKVPEKIPKSTDRQMARVTNFSMASPAGQAVTASVDDCELTTEFFLTPGTTLGMASRAFNICQHYNVKSALLLSKTDPAWFKRTYGIGDGTVDTINQGLVQAGYGESNFCICWERSRPTVVRR